MKEIKEIEITGNVDSIEELFEAWKKAHKEESKESCQKTFPKGIVDYKNFKESFCADGKFGDDASEIDILFICRESNVDEKPETDDLFWMKEVINGLNTEGLDSKDKRSVTKYHNCISKIAKTFGDVSLNNCAYMNINKRGGRSSCNMTRLRDYSIRYQNFIKEEIRLLKPKNIVILGNLPKETSRIIARNDIKTYIFPKHPSVYGKDEIKEFEKTKEKYLWRDDINE